MWPETLKRIEGQYGTGVVSYFVFLRWLVILNLVLFAVCVLLVTLPHELLSKLPHRDLVTAPNSSILTEEFVDRYSPSLDRSSGGAMDPSDKLTSLLSGIVIPDEILDLTVSYDRRNWTTQERRSRSDLCHARYRDTLLNRGSTVLVTVQDLMQGTGWLESTVLFLGYYSAWDVSLLGMRYNVAFAVLAALLLSFIICVLKMLLYSGAGVRESVLGKGSYLCYSNLLFCSWDFCIEDKKSSRIRHAAIRNDLKSRLLEERRRRLVAQWSRGRRFRVCCLRIGAHLLVAAIIAAAYYLIYRVVLYQLQEHRKSHSGLRALLVQYLSPVVLTALNLLLPPLLNGLLRFEHYAPSTQLNTALFRTVFIRLSSVFVLVGTLYKQITCEPKDACREGMTAACRSPLCWETYVGQQLYKLAMTDFIVYVMLFFAYDLPRDLLVRRFEENKVLRAVGRQVFDLPNQVLALVYSQTLCWLGIIYSPLLPLITLIKFVIVFYVKKVLVLKLCGPNPIAYRASRSNAMFSLTLMLSFFTLVVIHGFALASIAPSPGCGPFRFLSSMVDVVPEVLSAPAPILKFLFSGFFLAPLIVVLGVCVYYYWCVCAGHAKMLRVLQTQIVLEGRDKQFLLDRLTQLAKQQTLMQ